MFLTYAQSYACPECNGNMSITITNKDKYHLYEGEYYCSVCDCIFPVKGGISIFVRDLDKQKTHTARSFGYKWKKFAVIDHHYKKNFLDEIFPLDYRTFFKGKTVLDAGTGIGIPCYCIAEHGAKEVFAVDITESIRIAYENTKEFNNICVAQADIYKMPFKRNSFDVVVCVAVLQHLPNPWEAFDELLSFVKPGGTLILWVYANEGNNFVRFFVEPFRKWFTRKLPIQFVLGLSYFLGAIFQFLAQCVYKPMNKVNMTWLPLNNYIIYRTNFDYKMNTQMIFDQLLAPTSYLFSKKEIEQMFNRPTINLVTLRHHNSNSWTAIGNKAL
jgi:SAM-dependent methyltransferase